MTKRSGARRTAAPVAAVRVAVVLAVPLLLAVVTLLLSSVQTPARAADGLRAVTVMTDQQGAVEVVVQLDPAPIAPLADDAVSVTPAGGVPTASAGSSTVSPSGGSTSRLPAHVTPVLDLNAGTPVAFVVDASASGASALPQSLSGAAGMMLKLPSTNLVTVVADRQPPVLLASRDATPTVGIKALTSITASGNLATREALTLAVNSLQQPPPSQPSAVRLVVLTTSGPAPKAEELSSLVKDMQAKHVVLGVVGTGSAGTSWSDAATRTGGLAVAADPNDASAAYDALLAALQARYVVTFKAPPSLTQATVTVTSVGNPLSERVNLTPTQQSGGSATNAAPPARTSTSSGLGSRLWGLVAILLVVAAGIAAIAAVRLRGRTPAGDPEPATSAEEDDSALLPGVRMFDMSDPQALTEIAPAAPEQAYQGRHREPGVDAANIDDDEDDDEHADEHADESDEEGDEEDEAAPGARTPQEAVQDAVAGDRANGDGGRPQMHASDGENARPVKEAG